MTLLALLTLTLELVGVIGVLELPGVVAGCLVVGGLAWVVGTRCREAPRADAAAPGPTAPGPAPAPAPHRRPPAHRPPTRAPTPAPAAPRPRPIDGS